MAHVNLQIHGKSYGIACDEGQEARVADLGAYVDARLKDIAGSGAASTEAHLLVLTALVMADEIYELREALHRAGIQAEEQQQQILAAQHAAYRQQEAAPAPAINGTVISDDEENEILSTIDLLVARIDSVADRLTKI